MNPTGVVKAPFCGGFDQLEWARVGCQHDVGKPQLFMHATGLLSLMWD